MIIRKEINVKKPLTAKQQQMLEALYDRPIVPDDDIPELTEEQIRQLHPRRNPYAARLKKQGSQD